MESQRKERPWITLSNIIAKQNPSEIEAFIGSMNNSEMVHTLFKLSQQEQQQLISCLSPSKAAEIIEEVPESYAADVLEDIEPEKAASIVNEMASDEQADILQKLPQEEVTEILNHMEENEAEGLRTLLDYPPNVAGGLMQTELLSYPKHLKVTEVITDLTERSADYALYNVQYLYVVHTKRKLMGVLRLRDVVLSDPQTVISDLAVKPFTVQANTSLEDLLEFFETHEISACPVVDENNMLLGVIHQKSVVHALTEKAEFDHQKSQGIVSGEELRSMPTLTRSKRRLSWLSVNIVLNMIAASVIAMFEETLTAVIALAVFLPIVSDMSGCSGNQSVAVSMRELTLGIIRPIDAFRVWLNEVSVGALNGLVLGTLLSLAAWLWIGNPYLGIVVGSALALNTILAVSIGGTVPLLLKKLNVDPAIASGPILTTITDMCGFFLVLGIATLMLPLLTV